MAGTTTVPAAETRPDTKTARKPHRIKTSRGDKVFVVCNTIFLALVGLIVLYPLIYILSASFSSPRAVTTGQVWLFPKDFSLVGYETVFKNRYIGSGYLNSIYITVVGTVISVATTVMIAFPLSIRDLAGRNVIMGILTFTMLFSGGLIPSYLWINQLGLYNTYWALILPGCVGVYNVIIARTFFQSSIPYDLYESATLDGCSDIRYIFSIVLPLSKAIIAVLVMYYAVGYWNAYFSALIYISDSAKQPLQVVLRDIMTKNQIDPTTMVDVSLIQKKEGLAQLLKYSLIVVSSVPMLIIYPFVQKYFVKGVMIGALKG